MTTFGWDGSNHDDTPTSRDGIGLYTHKLSDGDHFYADPKYAAAMEAERSFGTPILGAYHVLHGGRSIASQCDWMIQLADQRTPWWRTFPYWVWQLDAEPFAYLTRPSLDECNAWGAYMAAHGGVPTTSILGYLPAWSYGTEVRRWAFPWWQSSYVTGSGPYRTLYPGDTSPHWIGGGRRADLLQYTSSAIIAGQTTCDANAFSGSLADLQAFLRPNPPGKEDDDMRLIYEATPTDKPPGTGSGSIWLLDGSVDETGKPYLWAPTLGAATDYQHAGIPLTTVLTPIHGAFYHRMPDGTPPPAAGGGLTEEEVRAVVRAELDKTHLAG